MKSFLFLDCNFLCWRSFHAVGHLGIGSVKTGVIFGFLKEIETLSSLFNPDQIIFCFDRGIPKRRDIYPGYKKTRHEKYTKPGVDSEELEMRKQMRSQVIKLRKVYLPKIGYKNIFSQGGYEADDLIAYLVQTLSDSDEAVIVSGDGDLYQLLSPNVRMYNPNKGKVVTSGSFKKQHGINPSEWWKVKQLCGCKSDEIPGIRGVGEATAIKHLKGILDSKSRGGRLVSSAPASLLALNEKLVRLPFPGVRNFKIRDDELSDEGYNFVCKKLGLKSMMKSGSKGIQRSELF